MVSFPRGAITYFLSNQRSATSNRQCSYPPSPLSSPRRVEEILIINCHLPIVVFGRPHRIAPINNLNSRSRSFHLLFAGCWLFLFFQPTIDKLQSAT